MRSDVGIFDVSHMGQVEIGGPQALERLQRLVSNDVRRIPEGGAQYSLLCNEHGGVLDDLFIYRLAENRFLTVTNAANHPTRPRLDAGARRGVRRRRIATARRASRCSPSRAPGARARRRRWPTASCPPRLHCCQRTRRRRAAAGLRHRLHRRGRRRAAAATPIRRRRCGPRCVEAGAQPVGLGARDTLRLEACFHLYGNDLDEQHDPISRRARLGLRRGRPASSAPRRSPQCGSAGPH